MKRSPSSSAKIKSVLVKRRPAPAKPVARKTSKPSASVAPAKTASAPARKRAAAAVKSSAPAPAQSKQSQLISLLSAASGASMAQLTALTGWKPHTVRGAISGSLRKRLGLDVRCLVEEGVRIYRIMGTSAP
ncbi:DUF3489 domain-containing protein [Hydrogenophaga sp. BPS33]|uniref:DUF3489 domain-containing protein n=1 Tax=Hydrogenophaga sp. BPS33 TaxID=2651974 RepID=UPI0013201581|nr:DUF3489 domain-containing protein [Hydrogenophaga sp. BPS33]QHE84804.1 DUF3489 domain-containing protein [Hydrogenophaga sp. BPS33]